LIFEWPSEVEFTAKVASGEAKILFKAVAQIDLHQLNTAASGLNPPRQPQQWQSPFTTEAAAGQ
jgi:hypothetical protein